MALARDVAGRVAAMARPRRKMRGLEALMMMMSLLLMVEMSDNALSTI